MAWLMVGLSAVGDWAEAQQNRFVAVPPSIEFAPVRRQHEVAEQILAELGLNGEVQRRSGTVRLFGEPDQLWSAALGYVDVTDLPREVEFGGDEPPPRPPPFVRREAATRIEGVPATGPGGRITQFAHRGGDFVDVSVRPVAILTDPGEWRDPGEVQAIAENLVGSVPNYELYVAFGYSEPSCYEAADRTDAAFSLLLDGFAPDGTGPRWQQCFEIPADRTLPVDD
ncbi:hypothetical protein ACXC9Q_35420 [Kribbella sp. CWNU-51]